MLSRSYKIVECPALDKANSDSDPGIDLHIFSIIINSYNNYIKKQNRPARNFFEYLFITADQTAVSASLSLAGTGVLVVV